MCWSSTATLPASKRRGRRWSPAGASLLTAASVSQAMAAVREHALDLAIIEGKVGEVDGVAIASAMRQEPRAQDVPIVLLTDAAPDAKWLAKAGDAGVVDVVVRPIAPHLLLNKAGLILSARAERRRLRQETEPRRAPAALQRADGRRPDPRSAHAADGDQPERRGHAGPHAGGLGSAGRTSHPRQHDPDVAALRPPAQPRARRRRGPRRELEEPPTCGRSLPRRWPTPSAAIRACASRSRRTAT